MITSGYFKEYFARLAKQHKQIKSFFFGDFDQILENERHENDYPILWLESPVIDFSDSLGSDELVESLSIDFVISHITKKGDHDSVKYAEFLTERIAKELLMKIQCDQQDEAHSFKIQRSRLEPVYPMNSNLEVGWRVTCVIMPELTSYSFADSFTSIFPAQTFPSFSWVITENAGTKTITVTNSVTPGLGQFTYQWTFYDPDGEQTNTIDPNPIFTTTHDRFYLELAITVNQETRTASGHFTESKDPMTGSSLPVKYNPFT